MLHCNPPFFADIMKIWLLSALMGCDASKSTDVIENEEIESDTFDFTDTQIDTIRSTWPILACDMVDIGSKVFLKIFIDEPKLKYAFPSFRYFDYIYFGVLGCCFFFIFYEWTLELQVFKGKFRGHTFCFFYIQLYIKDTFNF